MKSKGSLNSNEIKNDFPILSHEVNGQSLHYLDNAATTQKPEQVLKTVEEYNKKFNANPHRGAHYLSVKATEKYEEGRKKVKEFINANSAKEIIFTRNTTESLNLLAYSFAEKELESGDEVLISTAEHHSNILPWQQLSKRKDIKLKYLDINENGEIPFQEIKDKINKNTKILSITHMSNVTGLINDIQKITNYAHKKGVYVIVDGAQAVPHMKVDVQKLDVDFYAFSGHKMLGPMGIGVLYGKKDLLDEMPPFLTGGGMIEYVQKSSSSFAPIPERFEAGTPNVEGVVGLSAAIDYLEKIGMERVFEHEKKLLEYALNEMVKLDYLEIYGSENIENKGGIISFNIEGIHSHDSATIIDSKGVAVRSGHHCAQPLMAELGINSALRASFYIYNDREDIDALIEGIKKAKEMFSNGS
ncbi:MAG TPA: cysteine desulfurase [Halanaerobiales bacterium]|nr:cysteine desulfurase [Halanaerobiales bacterium]